MKVLNWNCLSNINFLLCLLASACLSIYSISRFIDNEDVTLVKLTKFQSTKDAIYPSLSFCILPPFLERKFDMYSNNDINMTSYTSFLKGDIWDERMLDVDYDDVSVNLSDNLLGAYLVSHDRNAQAVNLDHYTSFRSSRRKCFTINAPILRQKPLFFYRLYVKNDIFPSGKRSDDSRIFTYFHYPGQRFTSYYTIKYDFKDRKNPNESYVMIYSISNIDVVTRRNTLQEPCIEKWKNFDKYLMDEMVMKAGCHPPHWSSTQNFSLCKNKVQMKKFSRQPSTATVEMHIPPCKIIDRLDYFYEEIDAKNDDWK